MQLLKNKIIIIGADHHNTLAAIRCFGSMACRIQVLFISATRKEVKEIKCAHSKYCRGKAAVVSKDEKAIVDWLMEHGREDGEKPILFPCSDIIQYTFDLYYKTLENDFIFPGIADKPGRISFLMDKWNQSVYAREHDIPMAKTWRLAFDHETELPEDMIYPCIVKPGFSAHGEKSDIKVCGTGKELAAELQAYRTKGYRDALVQQFIKKDYEVCAFGCLVDAGDTDGGISDEAILRKVNYGCCIRKHREYPIGGGGSTTYAETIEDEKIGKVINKILFELYTEGFRGNYDIELMVLGDMIYLNEINFRQSANAFALSKFGIPAPYISCAGLIGMVEGLRYFHRPRTGLYLMNELNDGEHIREFGIGLFSWCRDFLRSKAYAFFSLRDLPGTFAFYNPVIRALPKHIRKLIHG